MIFHEILWKLTKFNKSNQNFMIVNDVKWYFCPLSSNFIVFAFVNANLKFFCSILVFFKFRNFRSSNVKVISKDIKVNITVTYTPALPTYIRLGWGWMEVDWNTLAYYDTSTIKAIKSFIVQALATRDHIHNTSLFF